MAKAHSTSHVTPPSAARRGVLLGALMALAAPKAATAEPATVEQVNAAARVVTEYRTACAVLIQGGAS